MRFTVTKISLLVFGSGFCALVYQMAWLRLLRLIFGSSTPATAAVLAIFMGGLGAGSLILGPRSDRQASPLGFYARLELGIAVSAAASPFLILLTRWLYIFAGGSQQLGPVTGSLLRILLATLVLGLPTFLMGGTLPAVTRAVERAEDPGRRLLGILYGANTLGAVLGALTTTFFSIEILGIRRSIWIASLINLLVVVLARRLAQSLAERGAAAREPTPAATDHEVRAIPSPAVATSAPARLVLISAAIVGFAFFLMELVWYRMLAPLLGGSSYTFGLILAVALAGIGAGGLLYGAGTRTRRPSLLAFSITCSLEALFLVIPLALGDRLAVVALVLRDLGGLGFPSLVLSWSVVVAVVVLPGAIIAGYQFPLLVAILGTGRDRVGTEVGWTYAWNTAGAILGSLAGGFGLIPLLSATGTWRLVVTVLVALAIVTGVFGTRRPAHRRLATPLAIALAALVLATSTGPTAFWRHSPIGAGRMKLTFADENDLTDQIRWKNRIILWEADGRESSIAMQSVDGASFVISGKVDGHARKDASTQVMSGLLGAALHPNPRHALVIGLGTGSTAGWLARVPTIEQVDVVELEPDIVEVARQCVPVNQDVLGNPKVHLIIGDGREILLTTGQRYDIVFSEPSNPYRAGIASLFTRDFYSAVSQRLTEDGIFIQWLQGYEVDGQIVRTAMATMGVVFDSVEIWHTNQSDLLLLASNRPIRHDTARLRDRLAAEPFKTAMSRIWGVEGAEGFYAGFVAADPLTRAILEQEDRWINSDDRPIIEFGFARNLGRAGRFKIEDLIQLARSRGEDRPSGVEEESLDWQQVVDLRAARTAAVNQSPHMPPDAPPDLASRIRARQHFVRQQLHRACTEWHTQDQQPTAPIDVLMLAECLADSGNHAAEPLIEQLRTDGRIIEAEAILARLVAKSGETESAGEHLTRAFEGYRSDPWPYPPTMTRLLLLAAELVREEPSLGPRIFKALEEPFAVDLLSELRRATLLDIARITGSNDLCLQAIEAFGRWYPWQENFLRERLRCLDENRHPLAGQARRDLEDFLVVAPFPLDTGLRPES